MAAEVRSEKAGCPFSIIATQHGSGSRQTCRAIRLRTIAGYVDAPAAKEFQCEWGLSDRIAVSGRDQMEELVAAEEAKKIIDTLSTTSPSDPTIAATLRNAYDQARRGATPILSSAMVLNAARYEAVLELNDLIHSLQFQSLTQQKINRAKAAVDAWIKLLKGHGWREIIFAEAVKEAAKEFKVAEALQDRIVATQDDL
jgi:hypothetical protein